MNTKLIIPAIVAILCGCAGVGKWTAHEDVEAGRSRGDRVNCRSTKIVKLFGLDNEVLADTNRFSKAQDPHVYYLTLPEPMCECSQAIVFMNDGVLSRKKGEPLKLRSVELKRTLREDAGDDGLEAEYQGTCEYVASLLGVEVGEVELESPKAFLKSKTNHPGWGMRSTTNFDLAEGQSVSVRAIEAIYTKRGNEYVVCSPAAIEIDFTYDSELFLRRVHGDTPGCRGDRPKASKTITVGPDCADLLSASMNDKQLRRKRMQKQSEARKTWSEAELYFKGENGHPKDWGKARELYLKAGAMFSKHDAGGSLAQLGTFYDLKHGPFEQDYAEAAKWYRKGVDFGNSWCMGKLSVLYREGRGVEKSVTNALKYAQMAADRKLGHYLAEHYEQGLGVEKNLAKALELRRTEAEWLNPSWDHGGPSFKVGELYEHGIGTPTNAVEAVKWYTKAKEQGNKKAEDKLKRMLK